MSLFHVATGRGGSLNEPPNFFSVLSKNLGRRRPGEVTLELDAVDVVVVNGLNRIGLRFFVFASSRFKRSISFLNAFSLSLASRSLLPDVGDDDIGFEAKRSRSRVIRKALSSRIRIGGKGH